MSRLGGVGIDFCMGAAVSEPFPHPKFETQRFLPN
jgi:hypothetical protein